jgi:hypothetical protein
VYLSACLFLVSAGHASLSLDSVLFPERYAPKTIFDIFFVMAYLGFSSLLMWPHDENSYYRGDDDDEPRQLHEEGEGSKSSGESCEKNEENRQFNVWSRHSRAAINEEG